MNQVAHVALIGTMVASVVGALIVCILVSLYGFATSPEGQAAGQSRRRSITRLGHGAAGASFGVAAVLAVVALAWPGSAASVHQEFRALSGRVSTVMAVLSQIVDAADRLRLTFEGLDHVVAPNGAIAPKAPRRPLARPLESAVADGRDGVAGDPPPAEPATVPPSSASLPGQPSALARPGGDQGAGTELPAALAPPAPSSVSSRPELAPRTAAVGSAGAGAQHAAPTRFEKIERPERILPPPRRRSSGSGGESTDLSLTPRASTLAPPRAVTPAPPPAVVARELPRSALPEPPKVAAPTTGSGPASSIAPGGGPAGGGKTLPETHEGITIQRPAPPSPERREAGPSLDRAEGAARADRSSAGGATPPGGATRVEGTAQTERGGSTNVAEPVGRPQRMERSERPRRPERADKPERPDRPERVDKPDKPDKPERPEKVERPRKPERIERVERPRRPERIERVERPQRPERPPRPERIEKPERRGRH